MLRRIFFIPLIALMLCGCADQPPGASTLPPDPPDLYQHILQFNPDGDALDPQTQQILNPQQTFQRFNGILADMDKFFVGKTHPNVLIYVHGGLDVPANSIAQAAVHLKEINTADSACYPLFVVWDSSILDTYGEHLFQVRRGLKDAQTERSGLLDFPIYFVSDILSALARAPTVWIQQRHTDDEAVQAAKSSFHQTAPLLVVTDFAAAATDAPVELLQQRQAGEASGEEASTTRPTTVPAVSETTAETWRAIPGNLTTLAFYVELNRLYYQDTNRPPDSPAGPPTQIAISLGRDYYHRSDWISSGASYTATLPAKFLTSPLIDAFGSPGWHGMLRRAETIVEGTSSSQAYIYAQAQSSPELDTIFNGTGGLDFFVRLLADRIHQGNRPWDVTLVAHSMGSMVLNDLLRRQLQREDAGGPVLPVKTIVYMAAACSIRDFTAAVIPFMESADHDQTRFFNLSLNPLAEVLEAEAGDLVPRGSLLCWVDDFLGTPETPLDRTLGRWDNLVPAPDVIPRRLRGRVAIKAFSLERPGIASKSPNWDPQKHGDFSDSPFWDQLFWQPDPAFSPNGPQGQALEQTRKELAKKLKPPPSP